MTNDSLLKGYTLERLMSIKDKESNLYTFLYNVCTAVLNRQEGSYFDYETDIDYAFLSTFLNVDGNTRFREFDHIPRDEFLLIMAEKTLQFLKTHPEAPKVKALKEASLGRFKDFLPEDIKEMLDCIGGLEFPDIAMLIKLQDHLRQYPDVYKQPANIGLSAKDEKLSAKTPKDKAGAAQDDNNTQDSDDDVILDNLRRGLSPKYAAKTLGVDEKTIYNKEAILRKELGSEKVPFRQAWRNPKKTKRGKTKLGNAGN
jgi:hypothetical protein